MKTVARTLRAVPTLLRVGLAEAMAYRAEMLVWLLSTNMSLIMLALWSSVAREGPVGRFDQQDFAAYYLATLLVRQLTGAAVIWELNYEIRHGTLALRLLRPIHPLVTLACSNLATLPMRLVSSLAVMVILVVLVGGSRLTHDPLLITLLPVALLGAWLITFLAMSIVGTLAFYVDSTTSLFEIWMMLFGLFSGYLVPLELFPPWFGYVARFLPFRYMLTFPVEVITGVHSRGSAFLDLGIQWAFVAVLLVATSWVWRSGLKRFAAFGG